MLLQHSGKYSPLRGCGTLFRVLHRLSRGDFERFFFSELDQICLSHGLTKLHYAMIIIIIKKFLEIPNNITWLTLAWRLLKFRFSGAVLFQDSAGSQSWSSLLPPFWTLLRTWTNHSTVRALIQSGSDMSPQQIGEKVNR